MKYHSFKTLYAAAFATLLFGCLLSVTCADEPKKEPAPKTEVSDYLQDVSCNIHAGQSQGSGVITRCGDYNYVFTAGHVIAHLRKTRTVIDKTGTAKEVIEFDDANVVQEQIEDGRTVGETRFAGEVLRYSNADTGEDLALLRLRKKSVKTSVVKFYLDEKIPKVGTELYHVGSLLGQGGYNSMTAGLLSQVGRIFQGVTFDQTSCTAFPGSSGGGVFLKSDGRYVGMLVRGSGETFNLIVPVRRMQSYAKRVGVLFTMDPKEKIPSEEELKKFPIEDTNSK